MNKLNIIIIAVFVGFSGFSQTLKDVKKIEQNLNNCFDNASMSMRYCTSSYYYSIDSLEKVVFKKLKTKALKNIVQNEKEWIVKKDLQFKKITNKMIKEIGPQTEWGQDDFMIETNEYGDFIKLRVKELINILNKKQ